MANGKPYKDRSWKTRKHPFMSPFPPKRVGSAKPPLPCRRRVTSTTSKATMWRWSIATTHNTPLPGCASGMPSRSGADKNYRRMADEQFTRLGKKTYPVLCSSPKKAIATADGYIAARHVPDIVFFDLPGTFLQIKKGQSENPVGMLC